MEIVEESGTSIALPSQTLHVSDGAGVVQGALPVGKPVARAEVT